MVGGPGLGRRSAVPYIPPRAGNVISQNLGPSGRIWTLSPDGGLADQYTVQKVGKKTKKKVILHSQKSERGVE